MARYNITHACGHTETVELYGKGSERERRIQWLSEKLCNDCYAKPFDTKLTGTERQIAWANEIRYYALAEIEHNRKIARQEWNKSNQKLWTHYSEDEIAQHLEEAETKLNKEEQIAKSIDSAKWWIDNRADTMRALEHYND